MMSRNYPAAADAACPDQDDVVYLSTLPLPPQTLDEFAAISPRLRVTQHPCASAGDIPADVWDTVQILHTSTALPDPAVARRLSWIQLDTAGVDHLAAHPIWTGTSIPVTTIGGVSARWTAEYVLMMILAASHRLPQMLELQRSRTWPDFAGRWQSFLPAPIEGATCAVIGFGRIGRAIGSMCAALGLNIIGIRRRAPEPGAGPDQAAIIPAGGVREAAGPDGPAPVGTVTVRGPDGLRDALAAADYVVVVLPLTAGTQMLLDRSLIDVIKPGAVLINVGRGGVVDEAAVADALRSGRLRGAAFDVFAEEPLPAGSPLWAAPGLVISPHVSGFAGDYQRQISALVGENLRRFLEGRPLLNTASREAGY